MYIVRILKKITLEEVNNMSRFMDFLIRLGENVYEARKESLNSMYGLNGILDENPETTGKAAKPVQGYTLHHCPVCNLEHY
jgi:hypothetical protein